MKVRAGYVSNSSSSSFIIAYNRDDEDVRKFLEGIELLEGTDLYTEVSDKETILDRLRDLIYYHTTTLEALADDEAWSRKCRLEYSCYEDKDGLRGELINNTKEKIAHYKELIRKIELASKNNEVVEVALSYHLPQKILNRFNALRKSGKIKVLRDDDE